MGELIEGKFPESNKEETTSSMLNIESFVFVLKTITKLIQNIPGKTDGNTYRRYIEQVSRYTDEELIRWINKAKEHQMIEKPLFFRAIIDISRQRDFCPKGRSSEDDEK